MDTAIYFGFAFIFWGVLYFIFAFIGHNNVFINSLFKVPRLVTILPDRFVLPVGRIIMGGICIGVGVAHIMYMSQFVS